MREQRSSFTLRCRRPILFKMPGGVDAGPTSPYQLSDSTDGNPASALVGTSGKEAARVCDVTAGGRSR
jgi:hypothetical protein